MIETKIKPSEKFTVEILEEWYPATTDAYGNQEGASLKQVIAKIKFFDNEFKIVATSYSDLAVMIGEILADIGAV